MSNSIAPGSSADVNVNVRALTTNPNVPAQYKTIILKKNLVNGVNTLTREMMSAQNTKYVVKYDYVLGDDINVPAGCILEFDGGSISASGNNDTITGQNTAIQAGLVKIFNTNVILDGDWSCNGHIRWFGAHPNNADNKNEIQKCFDVFKTCIVDNGTYNISGTLYVRKVINIIGESNNNYQHLLRNTNQASSTLIKYKANEISTLYINNINIVGFVPTDLPFVNGSIGIQTYDDENDGAHCNIVCDNVLFENFDSAIKSSIEHSIHHWASFYNTIRNCRFNYNRTCLDSFYANNLTILKNRFETFKTALSTHGDGPINIMYNSFESFGTSIISVLDVVKGSINFIGNYVETSANVLNSYVYGNRRFYFNGGINSICLIGNEFQFGGGYTEDRFYYNGESSDYKLPKSLVSINNKFKILDNDTCFEFYLYTYSNQNLKKLILLDYYEGDAFADARYESFNAKGRDINIAIDPFTGRKSVIPSSQIGLYADRPTSNIPIGYSYFATDKGASNIGAMIYYTDNSTTPWVYADGTPVS